MWTISQLSRKIEHVFLEKVLEKVFNAPCIIKFWVMMISNN